MFVKWKERMGWKERKEGTRLKSRDHRANETEKSKDTNIDEKTQENKS